MIRFLLFLLPAGLFAQNPFFIPPTLSGTSIDLNIQYGSVQFFPGTPTQTIGVNGNILGPTLLLNKDDVVTFNITNNLTDSTTIHWHGMHVSPENDGGPHIVIPPGDTWSPVIPIKDWASTYWYHPHMHMHTNDHVLKGFSGLVIVNDANEGALSLPRTYGVDDIPLIIQTKEFDLNNQISLVDHSLDTTVMVNGTVDPIVDVPAQLVRFRLLNGSSMRTYNLGLSNNQVFYQIGSDGGLLEAPVSMNRLMLAPGERAEIVVDLSGLFGQDIQIMGYSASLAEFPAGTYGSPQPGINSSQTIPNYSSNPLNHTNFKIIGLHVTAPTANPVLTLPSTLVNHSPWSASSAVTTRALTFTPVNMGPTAIEGPFLINGTSFNMMTINYTIPFNNTEIWTLTNQTPISHPFHIHDVQFYILDINGVAPPANLQGRKDVILVPGGMGTVRFITKFEDYYNDTLPYMYHCHLLPHEDDGMMGQFIVSSPLQEIGFQNNEQLIFPNPFTNEITLRSSNLGSIIQLTDLNGKLLSETECRSSEQHLNVQHLTSGIYFLRTISGGNISSYKLIKY